jgi:hypothetical protein
MSLYAALKVALPILNALPKESFVALSNMAHNLPSNTTKTLRGFLDSGLSEEERKSLEGSVKRVAKRHESE